MKKRIRIIYILLLLFIGTNVTLYAANNKRTINIYNKKNFINNLTRPNTVFRVRGNIDLKGETLVLPPSSSIVLNKGRITNGCLKGNETRLDIKKASSIGVVFEGTWLCPMINDGVFLTDYLSDDEIIANINRLQSKSIFNTVYLNKDKYIVSINESGGFSLCLLDSVKLINNSLIELESNNHKSYSIILISNSSNVEVQGGRIKGDVGRHTYQQGTTSEWGMGIYISASNNVNIHDILISHCTGDGIYITGLPTDYIGDYSMASKNVVLKNVVCDNNRRQGLSVISVDGLLVEECEFINTGKIEKASPAAGIDIEPNVDKGRNNSVRNIRINNCVFKGNAGRPFDVDMGVTDGTINNFENIIVSDCKADGPFFFGAQNVSVYNSSFESIIVRPFEAPVNCHFENCDIYGCGIIIKDALKHDKLYFNKSPKSSATITLNGCKLTYRSSSLNKTNKLVYFEASPNNRVSISFDSCNIIVPNKSSVRARERGNISVKFTKCDIKEEK